MAGSMIERSFLSQIERAISAAWGGEVHLFMQEIFEDHPHVIRLRVNQAPNAAPPTVIVKKSRATGQYPGSEIGLPNAFLRDWAGLEFLQTIMGIETVAPRVFTGSTDEGFLVMEDLGDRSPLENALWNGAFTEASQAMAHYGTLLGVLHGVSAGKNDIYNAVCGKLIAGGSVEPENFHHLIRTYVDDLEKLEVGFSPSALNELWDGAEILTHPGGLNVFTHGDPIGGNILDAGDRWRLIDFEAGRFQNGFLDGVFPRMVFPTSGLDRVMGVPEKVWRGAETAYCSKLGESLSEVQDEAVLGKAITAACAFWLLFTCHIWLKRALAGGFSPQRVSRVRQCVIARMERFIITCHEFHKMTSTGEIIEKLVKRLRSLWPDGDCDLPFYPAFL